MPARSTSKEGWDKAGGGKQARQDASAKPARETVKNFDTHETYPTGARPEGRGSPIPFLNQERGGHREAKMAKFLKSVISLITLSRAGTAQGLYFRARLGLIALNADLPASGPRMGRARSANRQTRMLP